METMLNTIAYYCGLSSSNATDAAVLPSKDGQDPVDFITQEEEGHWTIVDIHKNAANKENTTEKATKKVQSPSMECSWLVTPPPCFNAASSEPLAVLSDRENLLIEHPSMFVVSTSKDDVASPEQTTENSENKTVANTKRPHHAAALRRSQRKAARQASQQIARQQRKQNKKLNDVTKRSNKTFQKMRQIVHQPRKHN